MVGGPETSSRIPAELLTDEAAAELVLALPPLPKEIVDKLAAKADETVRRG